MSANLCRSRHFFQSDDHLQSPDLCPNSRWTYSLNNPAREKLSARAPDEVRSCAYSTPDEKSRGEREIEGCTCKRVFPGGGH